MQDPKDQRIKDGLAKFIPLEAVDLVFPYLKEHRVHLSVKSPRKSKLGDYRPPFQGKGHRISVNNNLNQFAFLITLVHEMAHLEVWNHFKNSVQPHGREWKRAFQLLIKPFFVKGVFPSDVQMALTSYMNNPAASSCVDLQLSKVLGKYDHTPKVMLSDLALHSVFALNNGLVLKKGKRLRKRYLCKDIRSGKEYTVSPIAEVEHLSGI